MYLKVGPEINHYLYSFVRPVGPPHCFNHSGGGNAEIFPFDVSVFDDTLGTLVEDAGIREVGVGDEAR